MGTLLPDFPSFCSTLLNEVRFELKLLKFSAPQLVPGTRMPNCDRRIGWHVVVRGMKMLVQAVCHCCFVSWSKYGCRCERSTLAVKDCSSSTGALNNTTAEQYHYHWLWQKTFLARLLSVFIVSLHAFVAYLTKQNMRTQKNSHIEHEQKMHSFVDQYWNWKDIS